jgi:hypothetical protein
MTDKSSICIIDEETGFIDNPSKINNTPVSAHSPSSSDNANHRPNNKYVAIAAASILLLAIASSAGWLAIRGGQADQETVAATPAAAPSARTPRHERRNLLTFGDEFVTNEDLGIEMSKGLKVRLIATSKENVKYTNGSESQIKYHEQSDAAGIIPLNPAYPLEDGYVYVTNSEMDDGEGGVYGIYFDKHGNIVEYKALLTDTTKNCGGGLSPWHTWISCEEYEDGQCWQVDPNPDSPNHQNPMKTRLGGDGGRYESVAVDNTDPMKPVFYTTEDHAEGALRRFAANGNTWDTLHSDGETTFLHIIDDTTYEWTTDEKEARDSAEKYYRNSEGIQYHDGKLYFMAKKDQKLLVLNLQRGTYETETTGMKFYGEGSFDNQPDQHLFGPSRKWIYFTEDGGDSPGVYARRGTDGAYYTLFQGVPGVYENDETVGIAVSPDGMRFYAGIQDEGLIFEFTREDGLAFE